MKIAFENVSTLYLENFNFEIEIKGLKIISDVGGDMPRRILRTIVGLDEIYKGRITVDDEDLQSFLARDAQIKNFGYIFDEGIMLSNLSLLENLMLPLGWVNPHIDKQQAQSEIEEWLGRFELDLDLAQRPVYYRNAQLKLLGWVRTLVVSPRVLLIENPFYLLNKGERGVIKRIISEIRGSYPILIASMDEDFIESIDAEIICLNS